MFRSLQKLILTMFFTAFAAQASAMFVQPDWLDPTQPGVGTNRYAYSNNDPINKFDPNGQNWRHKDFDSQEEADNWFSEQARSEYQAAKDIREGTGLWDSFRNFIGIAEEHERFGDNYAARIGLDTKTRSALDNGEIAQAVFEGLVTGAIARLGLPKSSGRPSVEGPPLPEGVGIGPYAAPNGGVSASRVNARPTAAEARAVTEQGKIYGCHNCGTLTPGTKSGKFVNDHQPPTKTNVNLGPQQYYPHCTSCSARQGGLLRWFAFDGYSE